MDSGHVAVPKQKDTTGYAHMYYGSTYNNPMAGRDVRMYLLDIINAFTAAGGFTAYLDRLNVHPVGADGGAGATLPASGAGVAASGNDRAVAPLSEILSMTLAIHSVRVHLWVFVKCSAVLTAAPCLCVCVVCVAMVRFLRRHLLGCTQVSASSC